MSSATPPPKAPPAGWYRDPTGTGLRWWDGQQWTQHVSTAAAGDELQPAKVDGDYRRHRRLVLTLVVAVVLGGVGIVALAKSGDDSQAAYADCRRAVQPVLSAMQDLRSHLDVGVIQSDYAVEVGDVRATFDRLTGKHPAAACQPVVLALGEAMDAYAQASSDWNYCTFSGEEGCAESSVQERWSDADLAVASAEQRLDSLADGSDAVATAESEAASVEADALAKEQLRTAQVAMETYATDHEASYEGATSAKLREIEPSLPSGLDVREAGLEYFSISVTSKSGNWFEVNYEVGGELTYRCGEPAKAGCPSSGEWE